MDIIHKNGHFYGLYHEEQKNKKKTLFKQT